MARVTYGSTVTALKGSIAGHTFQRNNSGDIVRLRPLRKSINTANQDYTANLFAVISRRWNGLSLARREAWNAFAVAHQKTSYWDETKTVTGFNYFMSVNINAFYLGVADFNDPPGYISVAPAPSFIAEITSSHIKALFSPSFDSGSYKIIGFCSAPIRQQSQINRKVLRYTSLFDNNVYSELDFTADWQDYFGLNWNSVFTSGKFYVFIALALIDPATCLSSIFTTSIAS
jgi:hypothetical protein